MFWNFWDVQRRSLGRLAAHLSCIDASSNTRQNTRKNSKKKNQLKRDLRTAPKATIRLPLGTMIYTHVGVLNA